MGKMQRTKGQVGEREFAKIIEQAFGVECKRRINQTRDSGHDLDFIDYAVEIKRAKKPNINSWWEQAYFNAKMVNKKPMLAYRLDNQKWKILLSYDEVLHRSEETSHYLTMELPTWIYYIESSRLQ